MGFKATFPREETLLLNRLRKKLRRVDSLRGVRVRGRARSEIRLAEINASLDVCAQVVIVMTP